jgi:hypothetical protein
MVVVKIVQSFFNVRAAEEEVILFKSLIGAKTGKILACVKSKSKLTKEIKKLAHILQVQYGNNL